MWLSKIVVLGSIREILKNWEFQIRILFRTHLWHFQQTSSWLLWGPTRPNHDWWCQYPLEGGSWTAKEARNVNSFYFPHTSLLLQNPYLKIAKKNRKCHLSDFLMSLKMFKKSSKNSKIIFFTTYFSSSYPMLNMSMHVWLFFPWERQQPERGRLLLPQSCKKLFKNRRK